MNKILKRQLKKCKLTADGVPQDAEAWAKFLSLVDAAYRQSDEDRYLLERSLEISSAEMLAEIDRNKKMSLQLAQAGKLASLGTLASGVAHELNNPLAGIKGHAELLQIRGLSSQNLKSVDAIVRLSERMASTIKHLLKLSRQSTDENDLAIDVRDPISDSLELLKRQFETEDIDVEIKCKTNSFFVVGNQNTITGVFQNLFSNSRDAYMNLDIERDCKISIEVSESEDSKYLQVIYRDNAGGMSDEVVNKIFDPFFTTKDVGMGTGLGLAIARQVIEEMGGNIEVRTFEGDGTEFKLLLLKAENKDANAINSIVDVDHIWAADEAKIKTRLYKTLIIDDEEDICQFLEKVLGGICELTTTTSSQQGLDLMTENEYDLVITDLKMPKISGIKVAEKLRQLPQTPQLIFISGHIDKSRDSELEPYSPYLLIEKPFPSPKTVIEKVYEYMQANSSKDIDRPAS